MLTVRRLLATLPAAALGLAVPASALAAGEEPAGGAGLGEVVGATAGASLATVALLALAAGHRFGRVSVLDRAAARSERFTGLPGWAALPASLTTASLLVALFGMYWDISLHIDVGRDAGPLANPAHYFILFGLFGIFSAGVLAIALPRDRPSDASVRIREGWHAPLGGILIAACGAFSLIGFPLDDIWHRLFGQDVTLWGPTHLMLIGGAAMTLVGIAVLLVEGRRAAADGDSRGESPRQRFLRGISLTGGFMIGLSTFQAEFDFGVPQFRFVFQPMLIMLAAGVGLVATRMWLGRGSALGAVVFFIVIRGLLSVLVGPVLGETTPHLPLYLAEALIVEAVALFVSTRRPLAFGLTSGVLIGTVGLAAEWGWSHVWMPLAWPADLLPEGALIGFAAAVAGSLIGAWIGAHLAAERIPRGAPLRAAAVVGAAGIAVLVAFALYKPADTGVNARVALTPAPNQDGDRAVTARVTLDPASAADDAEWLTVTAWQGEGLIVDRLQRVEPGVYRTTQPIPVSGNWKSLIRLHNGNSLTAVPLFLPKDQAIPAPEVPARAQFTRTFVADHQILQREQKASGGALTIMGYAVVIAIALSLLALLAWALHRVALTAAPGRTGPPTGSTSRRSGPQPRPPGGRSPAVSAG